MDIPAPQAGTVAELKVKVGDRVAEGDLILLLEAEGAAAIPPKERINEEAAPAPGRARRLRLAGRRLRDDRGQGPRHRRLQGRAGDRGAGRSRATTVKAEDPLITLESDKATMDVPSPAAGTVARAQGQGRRPGLRGRPDPARSQTGAAEPAPPPAPRRAADRADAQAAASPRKGDFHAEVLVLGAGPGRLHRRLPRRRPRQEGRAGRALADARRRLPQRRLHPVQGAAARRQGDRRGRGDGARTASSFGAPQIDLDKLRGWKDGVVKQADRRPRRPGQAAQGHGGRRAPAAFTSPEPARGRAATDGTQDRHASSRRSSPPAREPVTLPFIPHDDPRVIDSTGALELGGVPKRLLVIGGGIIGLEMATRLRRARREGDRGRADGPAHPRRRPRPRHAAARSGSRSATRRST